MLEEVRNLAFGRSFPGSRDYWENRYLQGRSSGKGSCGKVARFKAQVLNTFVREHDIKSIVELGCGEGRQLSLAEYPDYVGLDISPTAIALCRNRFRHDQSKRFIVYRPEEFALSPEMRAELGLSLEVVFHLVEGRLFEAYMQHLFACSSRHVIFFSSNTNLNLPFQGNHIRHRRFTDWIERHLPHWQLVEMIPKRLPIYRIKFNGCFSRFYIYRKMPCSWEHQTENNS